MKRSLNGAELAGYIKERQARQVRNLRQEHHIIPHLAIVAVEPNEPSQLYMQMKRRYGQDILAEVDVHTTTLDEARLTIERLNTAENVQGIIVQLPLPTTPEQTDEILASIDPSKDVDGLGPNSRFTPATALAIEWLLAGYNVELEHKNLVIIGQGHLVGAPLAKLWQSAGLNPILIDEHTTDSASKIAQADVVVTAVGVPGLLSSDSLKYDAVVVDAGTASEMGKIVGDVAEDVYDRDDITITPQKGGVGPLTVAALFDNLIQAARSHIK